MIQRLVSALLALALTAGAAWGTWTWWRGRRRMPRRPGNVIEGEYRIIDIR